MTPTKPQEEYAIVLPCDPGHFTDFVAGLLGKPQTIRNRFTGPFDISREDIENFYHLVLQRVTQQNEGTLIQFSVRVVYDDSSSVLLNSIEDFRHYNEIRPISSVAAHLSWSFLVRFQDRDVPEKQQIDVSIECQGHSAFGDDDIPVIVWNEGAGGVISFRIQHTARTWGADIEALLTGHIQTLIQKPPKFRRFVSRHGGAVGLTVGATFFIGALTSSIYSTQRFLHDRVDAVKGLAALNPTDPATTAKKVDHIIDLMASGMWPRFFYYLGFFLLLAFVAAVLLGIWAGTAAEKQQPSFVIFSKHAEKRKERLLQKDKAAWWSFIASLATSIVTGVTGNYLFAYYFQGWRP